MTKIEKIPEKTTWNNFNLGLKINEIIDYLNNSQQHDWIEYDREPNNTPIDICRDCPAHKYPDQPSKPSVRESVGQILIDYAVFGKKRKKAENQILDLITNAIMEEVRKCSHEERLEKGWLVAKTENKYVVGVGTLREVLNNIKK